MPRLIVHPRTSSAWEIQLKPGENSFGRAIVNDFMIEDPSVSGSHCRIMVEEGRITVKDLGSTNGTFLNRTPVQEAALKPGQTLHLGGVELLFDPEDIGASAVAPPPPPPLFQPLSEVKLSEAPRPVRALATPVPAAQPAAMDDEPSAPPLQRSSPATAIHVGEQSCKFHPKSAARWLCERCNKYFCDVCVTIKRLGPATQHLCRGCGGDCLPVLATAKVQKSKGVKQYSDGVILARAVGFGFVGAIVSILFWTAMVWVTNGVDVSFIYSMVGGALCGYAVKLGAQDRPGGIFSAIAIFFCIITMAVSKYMVYVMDFPLFGSFTKLATDIAGVVGGIAIAWWVGGGD